MAHTIHAYHDRVELELNDGQGCSCWYCQRDRDLARLIGSSRIRLRSMNPTIGTDQESGGMIVSVEVDLGSLRPDQVSALQRRVAERSGVPLETVEATWSDSGLNLIVNPEPALVIEDHRGEDNMARLIPKGATEPPPSWRSPREN